MSQPAIQNATQSESWAVYRFRVDDVEEAIRSLSLIASLNKTGTLVFNVNQGGFGVVEWKEKVKNK